MLSFPREMGYPSFVLILSNLSLGLLVFQGTEVVVVGEVVVDVVVVVVVVVVGLTCNIISTQGSSDGAVRKVT